jgi:hypothetical protein
MPTMTGGRLMPPVDWCEVMQLPASGCYHCRPGVITQRGQQGGGGAPAAVLMAWEELWELAESGMRKETGPLIESQYGGRCRACTERWEPGDFIAFSEDEDGWICADCAR